MIPKSLDQVCSGDVTDSWLAKVSLVTSKRLDSAQSIVQNTPFSCKSTVQRIGARKRQNGDVSGAFYIFCQVLRKLLSQTKPTAPVCGKLLVQDGVQGHRSISHTHTCFAESQGQPLAPCCLRHPQEKLSGWDEFLLWPVLR